MSGYIARRKAYEILVRGGVLWPQVMEYISSLEMTLLDYEERIQKLEEARGDTSKKP